MLSLFQFSEAQPQPIATGIRPRYVARVDNGLQLGCAMVVSCTLLIKAALPGCAAAVASDFVLIGI